ncbi:MAG: GNAT family N-acetyltransferase [Thiobacillus sp.]|nr:GNAT family N-acetyltransferase [Thiobacillus sp.]
MNALLKKLARWLLGDYSPYFIYTCALSPDAPVDHDAASDIDIRPVDASLLGASADALIRAQAGYAGEGSHAYAAFDGERIVGVCFYWFGERYRTRNFWPLIDGEAKLVQIVVLPDVRGRGIAPRLIQTASRELAQKAFCRAYARIWHSNTPSLRAFERAGWARIAFVFECHPLRRSRPMRIRLRVGDRNR